MRLELKVGGMTSLDCARHVEGALRSVRGVRDAKVRYPAATGTVAAPDGVDVAELLRAVERAGYRAGVVEDDVTRTMGVPHQAKDSVPSPRPGVVAGGEAGEFDYDLVVIGSGGAGMAAAIRAAELGRTAAVIEGAEVVGGTCVNIGCIPSKYLIEAAHHYHTARTAFPGVGPCTPDLTWTEVIRRKDEIVSTLRQEKYLDVLGGYDDVTLLRGRAKLLGHGYVRVGERKVRARKIVLATGTRPSLPPIPGLKEAGALDSTTAMALGTLPASMIVIGGGSVGLELGQAFSRFGVMVIVVEVQERIVPGEDPDLSGALREALEAEGIDIRTGAKITRVSREDAGYTVHLEEGSPAAEIRAEQLLVATGRRPNTESLGLEDAGVETDRRGFVRVDEFMRTSHPDVFAAGDVTGGPGFVYQAAYEGGIAAQAALAEITGEEPIAIEYSATPRVTFTDPQGAAVGMTEEEARAAGIDAKVISLPVAYLPRAIVSDRRQGVIKLVADAASDRLLGAHLVSANAGDILGEMVLAIRFGLRIQEVVSTLHPYLTWNEGLKLAAQTFTRDVAKLSCCA